MSVKISCEKSLEDLIETNENIAIVGGVKLENRQFINSNVQGICSMLLRL